MNAVIIAALIGALGAIIAAVITAIALIHSNKRNSNNPPSNTNVALPQPPAQSYTVGRTVNPSSNIYVSSSKQPVQPYIPYTYKQTLWDKIMGSELLSVLIGTAIMYGVIAFLFYFFFPEEFMNFPEEFMNDLNELKNRFLK